MKRIVRPWGWMVVLYASDTIWIKLIRVQRGKRTSLQFHNDRTEWHVSISGIRKVLPKEVHRMTSGFYLEVARGKPTEDDIVRIQDDYGRIEESDRVTAIAHRADDRRL